MLYCKICYREFTPKTNSVCCSDACRLENKRQSRRRSYHKVSKFTDDRYLRTIKQRMRRIRQRIEKRQGDN
jgi:hypothetical protein